MKIIEELNNENHLSSQIDSVYHQLREDNLIIPSNYIGLYIKNGNLSF